MGMWHNKTKGEKRRAAIREQFKKPSVFNDNYVWVSPNITEHDITILVDGTEVILKGVKYVDALIEEFTKLIGG